jgi:hypothetical protein
MSDNDNLPPDVIDLAEARKNRRTRRKQPAELEPTNPDMPVVRLKAGELTRVMDEAEAILLKAGVELFTSTQRIVKPSWVNVRASGGGMVDVLELTQIDWITMFQIFSRLIRFESFDLRTGGWKPDNLPDKVAKMYVSAANNPNLPPVLGIITAPTMRADGTILDKPVYDEATGLYFNPLGKVFPA